MRPIPLQNMAAVHRTRLSTRIDRTTFKIFKFIFTSQLMHQIDFTMCDSILTGNYSIFSFLIFFPAVSASMHPNGRFPFPGIALQPPKQTLVIAYPVIYQASIESYTTTFFHKCLHSSINFRWMGSVW